MANVDNMMIIGLQMKELVFFKKITGLLTLCVSCVVFESFGTIHFSRDVFCRDKLFQGSMPVSSTSSNGLIQIYPSILNPFKFLLGL